MSPKNPRLLWKWVGGCVGGSMSHGILSVYTLLKVVGYFLSMSVMGFQKKV